MCGMSRTGKSTETGSGFVAGSGWGVAADGDGAYFGRDENVVALDRDGGYTTW